MDIYKFSLNCPLPIFDYKEILLAHGGGGTLSRKLLKDIFYSQFGNPHLLEEMDSALININSERIAFTTDSYVVNPIFFPGGSIGDLAINGTVNDLAVCGAIPKYISVGFILEEGLPLADLWEIVLSMKNAADIAGVQIVTGDTKVVDRGKGDKIFINTSGIGEIVNGVELSPVKCKPGDKIIINGRIAEHGIAIMASREGLEFESEIESDTAALNKLIDGVLKSSNQVRVMRDPTRGGVASTLNEIADKASVGIKIYENKIPIREDVNSACEILGLDPLYIANEGKAIIIVAEEDASKVLEKMRLNELGINSAIIGEVTEENSGMVIMETMIGTSRIVDMISGEQLPRIC
ncbi:MAG: hydrogenase expression/formation protein HypE [Bacteroidetes bacterium]|nr:hydrogenase expression/formation protein HypE [Bacteroidota bacterium]